MMKKAYFSIIFMLLIAFVVSGCTPSEPQTSVLPTNQETANKATTSPGDFHTLKPTAKPGQLRDVNPTDNQTANDTDAVVYFTVAIHLEGWSDGDNRKKFAAHAQKLREYADLFEKYGGVMTLESKEIIDGCIRWDDNVLLELQQRGHAVGIHADSGGERNATTASITRDLADMKKKLNTLGIEPRFASGVASRADWVAACRDAGMEAVTCMVNYGLWSLNPALRPDWFVPYKTPVQGHSHYPKEIEDRLHGWLACDGATWTQNDPEGSVLIIPSGLSLNNAYEEYVQGENTIKTEFTQEDIDAWAKALPVVLDAAEPGKVNTFYAVWSFGSPVDMELLEQWLRLIDGYVKQGRIRWANMDEMIDLY